MINAPNFTQQTDDTLLAIATGEITAAELTDADLVHAIDMFEAAYRRGEPMVSDERFDHEFMAELGRRQPEHPRLVQIGIEAEETFGAERITHRRPMLSTDKAYTNEELQRWLDRIAKAGSAADLTPDQIKVCITPKLDGLAGNDDPATGRLATRGDGLHGFDVTHVFDRGVVPVGGRGRGLGELVLDQGYFQRHMADSFEHPRNAMVGITKADEVGQGGRTALAAGAARFVPYDVLPRWVGTVQELYERPLDLLFDLLDKWHVPYATDGLVAAVEEPVIQEAMGATSHHYRWQIALKRRGERAETTVRDILLQIGRTGVVTPVLAVDPVKISGATVSRVTGHNAGLLEKLEAGRGARVAIVRSGEVIPWVERVVQAADVSLPEHCPSCQSHLVREGDHLKCPNTMDCPAQVERALNHFFHTLGNADLFGQRTIEKLVKAKVTELAAIYAMDADRFEALGFGPGQSANLVRELARSRQQAVEDWRFLAAFGLPHLGKGMARRLLEHCRLADVVELGASELMAIEGFGPTTAPIITEALRDNWPTIQSMITLGFNLTTTPLASERPSSDSPIAGRGIVFTGTMQSGDRKAMEKQAAALGAIVQSAVSKKTDYLVCGQKVGASKIEKAQKMGTAILTEDAYLTMLEGA